MYNIKLLNMVPKEVNFLFKYWFVNDEDLGNIINEYPFIQGLRFEFKYKTTRSEQKYKDVEDELEPWLIQLRMRLRELRFSIVNIIYYYNMDLDDRTKCELGIKNGRYFPKLSEQERYYHFYLNYFYGNFQIQYMTILDAIYHVLNIYYDLEVKSSIAFHKNIVKRIKNKNFTLGKELDEFFKKCEISKYRNDKIHNYDPNIPDIAYTNTKKGKKVQSSNSPYICPRYMHAKEKFKILNKECLKLEDFLKVVKRHMKQDKNKHLQ